MKHWRAAFEEHFAESYFQEFFAKIGDLKDEEVQITLTKMIG